MTPELATALDALADARGDDRSRLIETLLRENPIVHARIQRDRRGAWAPQTKKGRDLDKLRTLGRAAGRNWDRKVASGKVKIIAGRR